MADPKIYDKVPVKVSVEAGKTYSWCTCGESSKQPFCDGSHRGGPFVPLKFEASESKDVWLCNCKHTKNPGYCDGSHKAL